MKMWKVSVTVCALLLSVSTCFAEPPSVLIAIETKAEGDYVTIVPKTNAKAITYIGKSGVEPFPSILLKDDKVFVLTTRGLTDGKYEFEGVASLNDEHTRFKFYVLKGSNPNPPNPNPNPPQPVDVFGLTKVSKDAVPNDTAENRAKLNQSLNSFATAIAAGAFEDSPAKILAGYKEAAKVVDSVKWGDWSKAVAVKLQDLYNGQKLKNRQDWSQAFREIADGLK